MRKRAIVAIGGLLLAGCAGKPEAVVDRAPHGPTVVAAPAPTPTNAGLSQAATLWHLRAGLNVAALACRGPDAAALVARYNALLAAHASALRSAEAAYRAAYEAQGGEWRDRFDDDQTRLYNFWGQPHGRAGLCAAAGATLMSMHDADEARFSAMASARLAVLDRAFAPPRLEVDARVFAAPVAAAMLASR